MSENPNNIPATPAPAPEKPEPVTDETEKPKDE